MTSNDISGIDSAGMFDLLRTFPDQWREGRRRALDSDLGRLTPQGSAPVLVAGMGGSAIGGDLFRTLAVGQAQAPVVVQRSYRLPAWVDAETTVIVSSFSGHTEETLSVMDAAMERGARVACVTSGGVVRERAEAEGLPLVVLPDGMPPRAALGSSLTAVLTIAERIGVLRLPDEDWDETHEVLEAQTRELADVEDNEALRLAGILEGHLPFIYSAEGLLEAVNLRWRTQLNENAKVLAGGNVFPEMNHNEIMGWQEGTPLTGHISVVMLRDRDEDARVARRIDVTRALVADRAGSWTEVWSRGESVLCRVLSLVNLGDWVSLYLALLTGIDPTPIPLINRLKEALAEVA